MKRPASLIDPLRQDKRDEICALTEAILRLSKAGFQNVPLADLRRARQALESAVRATPEPIRPPEAALN